MPQNQIRWYAPGTDSIPVSRREFEALDKDGQAGLLNQFKRLQRAEISLRNMRHLGDQLYEIRVEVRGNQYRATVYQDSPVHYIIFSCFHKKQRPEQAEVKKAKARLKTWLENKKPR